MLTNEMRRWLGSVQTNQYLSDIVQGFMCEFGLDSIQTGKLIMQWIAEAEANRVSFDWTAKKEAVH